MFVSAPNKTGMGRRCPKHLIFRLIFILSIQLVANGFGISLYGHKFAKVLNALANDGLGVEEYQVCQTKTVSNQTI